MTTLARSRTRSQRRRDAHPRPAPTASAPVSKAPVPAINPHDRGGRVLFEIHFTRSMTDADLDLLRRQLDMTLHTAHKLPVDPNSPGVTWLDRFSGLYLEHGAGQDRWVLQARTWGEPPAATVHDWHVCAAQTARLLDPRVRRVERWLHAEPDVAQRPVGGAQNRRVAGVRQRLVGLP